MSTFPPDKPKFLEELLEMMAQEKSDLARYELSEDDILPLKIWVEDRLLPGDFLQAVLRNDLCEAARRADVFNRRRLFEYVQWIYNEAPSKCWGSPEKVAAWAKGEAENE